MPYALFYSEKGLVKMRLIAKIYEIYDKYYVTVNRLFKHAYPLSLTIKKLRHLKNHAAKCLNITIFYVTSPIFCRSRAYNLRAGQPMSLKFINNGAKINSQAIKLYKKSGFLYSWLDIIAVKAAKNKQMFISDMPLFKVNYVWHSTVYLWYIQRF